MTHRRTGKALGLLGAAALVALLVAERRRPLRRQKYPALPRDTRNLTMGTMCAAVVATIETPLTQAVARRNERDRRGLAHLLPRPLQGVVAFLAMDYGFYLWHVATHRVPALWRLHRVHHVDPDMDASTAVRFHMLDMLCRFPGGWCRYARAEYHPARFTRGANSSLPRSCFTILTSRCPKSGIEDCRWW